MNNINVDLLTQVIGHYPLQGTIKEASPCVNGHINDTYRLSLAPESGPNQELILQRINDHVFAEPEKVMHNIQEIAAHLRQKNSAYDCDIISFMPTKDGRSCAVVNEQYWRLCHYVPNSVTYDFVDDSSLLYSAGYAFGQFQSMLADLPMDRLYETIPDFHHTRKRLDAFFATVDKDPAGRAKEIEEDIAFFAEHRELACQLMDMQEAGILPLRVTHNDTKYNNILMHEETGEPLCVIDLDTVMPGLPAHDFGDAIRFAANTAVEDEPDLSKVGLNMGKYREFTRGFLQACSGFLTEKEIETLALGAITITVELASRFLTDHIEGDKYFKIHRPNHNLERARCQIALAQDMLGRYNEMQEIVMSSAQG